MWCRNRKSAEELYTHIKSIKRNVVKKRHVSIGTTYKDRKRRTKQAITPIIEKRLTFMHWNARSLMNKVEELKQVIDDTQVKVICVQEACLPLDEKRHPRFKDFRIFNFSRPNKRGGGVASIIHRSVVVSNHKQIITTNMEVLTCDITLSQDVVVKLINVYIFNQNVTLDELLKLDCSTKYLLIMGDFNAKHAAWNEGAENRNGPLVYNWILSSNLILLNQNKEPTYQSPSSGSLSTLDLTLISPDMIDIIKDWRIESDLTSDHFPIFFSVDSGKNDQARNAITTKFKVKEANWTLFKLHTSNCNANSIDEIENSIITAASKCIPTSKPNRRQKPSNIWWTKEISALRKARQRARKQWKKFRTPAFRSEYNKASAKCKRAVKAAKRTSWRNFVNGINSNTPCSAVWKRFRAIQGKADQKIFQIQTATGLTVTSEREIAEVFNKMYMGKSGDEAIWPSHLKPRKHRFSVELDAAISQKDDCDPPFTSSEMRAAIDQLKPSTPGGDNVHLSLIHI